MPQPSKEPCKKEACDIQACLSKNNFLPHKCVKVIQLLQYCCENCDYKSTHCASVSDLLKQMPKPKGQKSYIQDKPDVTQSRSNTPH